MTYVSQLAKLLPDILLHIYTIYYTMSISTNMWGNYLLFWLSYVMLAEEDGIMRKPRFFKC